MLGCGGGDHELNQCSRQRDCSEGLRCSEGERICYQTTSKRPYDLVLQVARLPSRGAYVRGFSTSPKSFAASDEAFDIDVPEAAVISGRVWGMLGDAEILINAELAFTPESRQQGLPAAAVVVESRRYSTPSRDNYRAVLVPNTRYLVRAIPLGEEGSQLFPPYETEIETSEGEMRLDLVYDGLTAVNATLTEQTGAARPGARIRMVDLVTGRVVSSTAVTALGAEEDGGEEAAGKFTLHVQPEVLSRGGYAFEVDLSPSRPFQISLRIDPSYLDPAKRSLSMPTIPTPVSFQGRVERADEPNRPLRAHLVFRSRFAIPTESGPLGDRDFCRSVIAGDTRPSFECQATVLTDTDEQGGFAVGLLPGDYDVFVSPVIDSDGSQRVASSTAHVVIETQPGGSPQRGQVLTLQRGALYRGRVRDPWGEPLGNVLVRADALQLVGYLGEVAAYNRSAETYSDEDGDFELGVDVGYYDLVARPADALAWLYVPNRAIAPGAGTIDISGFVLQPPMLLAGRVLAGGALVASAKIDAYAVISDLSGGSRSVLVGQAVSDHDGRYRLLLPAEIIFPK